MHATELILMMTSGKSSSTYTVVLTLIAIAAIMGAVALPYLGNPASACTTRCWNDPSEQHRSDNSYVADSHYQGNPQGPP
jgi:hypothetical protein